MEITVLSLTQLLKSSEKLKDKIAGSGDTKFLKGGTFWKISWMKLWHAWAPSPNKLRVWLYPTFLTNGWKKILAMDLLSYRRLSLFVCFTDRLANFRSQDWKIFGHAPYRDDDGLVQPVGPRLVQSWLFTVLYFSVQMALFPGSKISCKLLNPNSRNESRLCDVFSEQFVGALKDQYFNKQATLVSTQASRTCTAHNCLQPDWLYLNASQYTISKCV